MTRSNLGKGFVSKKVLINGIETDVSIPINALERWKDLIVE